MSSQLPLRSRMSEQLRALWLTKDREQPFVKGYLKTKIKRTYLNGHTDGTSDAGANVVERCFTLLGHCLFHCLQKDSVDFTGALLTDVFSPVIARVDDKKLESFHADETLQANSLYLEGVLMGDVDILLCPSTAEEKRTWLDLIQQAGLEVPARRQSNKSLAGRDGRKKVVIIDADVNDSLYTRQESVVSPDQHRAWKHQWKLAARRVLSRPEASQMRMKHEVLERLVVNEERYVSDLSTLVEVYFRPIKTAIASGHVNIPWTRIDTIFLNCESLFTFHKIFLSQMRGSIVLPHPNFGQLLLRFISHLSLYADFVKSQDHSSKVLEECLVNPSLTDYLENYHSSHDCEAQHLKMLLQQPTGRLVIYEAFLEDMLKQTSESHCDYAPLGTALQELGDIKASLSSLSGIHERQENMLSILGSVGPRGLILLEPDCSLVLESDTFLPASSKWTTGTIKQRKVHCYLYTNALVVVAGDRKAKNQLLPLCGATVYENVSRTGDVTYAKNPEVEARALKLYSPDGPRNGVVIIFFTQSTKSVWLAKICEIISHCTPGDSSPSPSPSPSPSQTARRVHTPALLTSSTQVTSPTHNTPPQLSPALRRASVAIAPVNDQHSSPSHHPFTYPETTSQRTTKPHPLLSSSVSLSSLEKRERETCFASSTSVDQLRLSHSNSSAQSHSCVTRSTSMFLVPAELPPARPKVVRDYYSIPTLFSLLTCNPPSPRYPATFLLTYRMFTNAHEVLDALIDEHRTGLDGRTQLRKAFSVSSESLRFFNTLRIWVNKYYVDFHHDVSLKQMLMVYLNSIKDHEYLHSKEGELVKGILRTVNTRGHIPLIRKSKLKIQVPKALRRVPDSLLSIPTEQLAKQLTWMEHEIYGRIKPYEFLQQKWTKKNKLELAPNICYVISRFNEVTLWLTKEVLSPVTPRKRCAIVQHLIEVTKHCLELGNFVTVFQITSALSSSSIQRLKKTWDHLPHNVRDTFEELRALTSVDGGSKVYRLRQKSSPSPSIPYIGPYLNLLVSIEVGMSTFVKNPPEHVNFLKLTKLASVIEEVTRFQNPKYSIPADGSVLVYLDNQLESSREFDEEQGYTRSVEVEPKQDPGSRSRKKSLSNLLSGD